MGISWEVPTFQDGFLEITIHPKVAEDFHHVQLAVVQKDFPKFPEAEG